MAKKIPSRKLSTTKKKIPSSKFPKSKKKIPSRKLAKGTVKNASRKFPNASKAASKKPESPTLPDRPTNEAERQDRIATLKEKLNLKSLGDLK